MSFVARKKDTYEQWEADGILEERLKYTEKLAAERVAQSTIADALGICHKTFIELKSKHPRFNMAVINGSTKMKVMLEDTLLKTALGYYYEEDDQYIEEVNGKPKRKVGKLKKYKHPDYKALKSVLLNKFGNEYNEKRFDYELEEKRKKENEEVWENANNNDEE